MPRVRSSTTLVRLRRRKLFRLSAGPLIGPHFTRADNSRCDGIRLAANAGALVTVRLSRVIARPDHSIAAAAAAAAAAGVVGGEPTPPLLPVVSAEIVPSTVVGGGSSPADPPVPNADPVPALPAVADVMPLLPSPPLPPAPPPAPAACTGPEVKMKTAQAAQSHAARVADGPRLQPVTRFALAIASKHRAATHTSQRRATGPTTAIPRATRRTEYRLSPAYAAGGGFRRAQARDSRALLHNGDPLCAYTRECDATNRCIYSISRDVAGRWLDHHQFNPGGTGPIDRSRHSRCWDCRPRIACYICYIPMGIA
jgi:hypothetical protein